MRLVALVVLAAFMLVSCGDDRPATPKGSDAKEGGSGSGDFQPLDYTPSPDKPDTPPPEKPAKPADPDQPLFDKARKKMASSDYEVRAEAVILLQEARDKTAAGKLLLDLLRDEEEDVREMAATALGKVKYRGGVDALRALLGKEREASVRKSALQSLFVIGGESVVNDLVRVLQNDSENGYVKEAAANLLGNTKTDAGAKALVKALEDFDEKVRLAAVASVRRRRIESAAVIVFELTEDTNVVVRAEAARALGEMGVKKAVPALINMLDAGESMQVLENATRSLSTLTGEKKGMQYTQDADSDEKAAVLKAWEDWWQEHRDEY